MKDNIINILKNNDKPLDAIEIKDALNLSNDKDLEELLKVLLELEEDNTIYHTKKDKYMLIEDSHLKKGLLRVNKKGFGFVEVSNSDGEKRTAKVKNPTEEIFSDIQEENFTETIYPEIILTEDSKIGYSLNDSGEIENYIFFYQFIFIFIISYKLFQIFFSAKFHY